MKSLIVTVAGTATRFNRDTQSDTLKCIYYKESPKYSLLYQILDKSRDYDEMIIVGGYLYDKLQAFVQIELKEFFGKIKCVYNEHFKDYGSGWSLIKGINATSNESTEILFVEGDLFVDTESYQMIKKTSLDAITINTDAILANKAVVLYVDELNHLHYIYDTSHKTLFIPEPFLAVYNSGQIWKFSDVARVHHIIDGLTDKQAQGTNLEIVQQYYGALDINDIFVQKMKTWYNCNTVADYELVYQMLIDQ